jgi:penicillin-binding protein 1C
MRIGGILNNIKQKYMTKAGKVKIPALVILSVLLIIYWFSLPSKLFDNPLSTIICDRNDNILGVKIAGDYQWRFPVPDSIPHKYKESLLMFEDEYFYYHPGFNPVSIFRAFRQNINAGKVVSGGSTISMQVIRMSRGNRKRTVFEKIKEIILATRLELGYSKHEIMKLYAANAPFGGNIVGLEAASWKYFKRKPSDLSWSESALLAVLPNSPALLYAGRNNSKLLIKRNLLLDKLKSKGRIDEMTCKMAKEEDIPERFYSFPNYTPHLLARISRMKSKKYVKTTIDIELQKKVNRLVDKHSSMLGENGINNASAIVVEVSTGNVVAYVGNSFCNSAEDNGNMVDINMSPRSSGSIIKPVLYCLMQDKGYMLPNTLLPDTPIRFGNYCPKNFSLKYDGAVPASKALARSLNVPAVNMLKTCGVNQFYDYLKRLNLTTLNRPASHYGLSLILGGAEVTLYELAGLYRGMAKTLRDYNENDGSYYTNTYIKPNYFKNANLPERKEIDGKGILSAGAIWLSFKALLDVERPDEEAGWESFKSSRNIAWKTGTSFGFRDAWSVGVTPEYVVGVWAGNADGEGRPGLTGVRAAAPLMFDIFSILPKSGWFKMPFDEMVQIPVCSKSGYRVGIDCDCCDTIWACEAGLKTVSCPYHKIVHLDKECKYRVNSNCEEVPNMVHKSWFVLPPVMEWYYKKNNPYYHSLPPYRSDCTREEECPMQLIYPHKNLSVFVPKDMGGVKGKIIFEAAHSIEGSAIYWHMDETFLEKTTGKHQIEVCPKPGKHLITLVDEFGNILKRFIRVK